MNQILIFYCHSQIFALIELILVILLLFDFILLPNMYIVLSVIGIIAVDLKEATARYGLQRHIRRRAVDLAH
jgi:hypothetical protein